MAVVGVPTSVVLINERKIYTHTAGTRYMDTLADAAGVMPIALPSMPEKLSVKEIVKMIDGLFLSGGRANVEPHHFGGEPFPEDEPIDPKRDNAVLPLVRACIDEGVPIFGSCRGIQEINVALGGSLHYRLHVLPGKMDHRMPRGDDVTIEQVMAPRHTIALSEDGVFAELTGKDEVIVNSLHGQGIDRVADGVEVEATAPDGVIEGIRVAGTDTFTIGVQWHTEWKPDEHELSRKLYQAFGDAARERAKRKNGAR